jgi:hypothetical protein
MGSQSPFSPLIQVFRCGEKLSVPLHLLDNEFNTCPL